MKGINEALQWEVTDGENCVDSRWSLEAELAGLLLHWLGRLMEGEPKGWPEALAELGERKQQSRGPRVAGTNAASVQAAPSTNLHSASGLCPTAHDALRG